MRNEKCINNLLIMMRNHDNRGKKYDAESKADWQSAKLLHQVFIEE